MPNILEKSFDLGFNKFLDPNEFQKLNQTDIPFYLIKDYKKSLRFLNSQQPDRILLSRKYGNFAFELKHSKGKSIPLSRLRKNQISFLEKFEKTSGRSFFILAFNEMEKIYLIKIQSILTIMHNIGMKKSINMKDIDTETPIILPMNKLKKNFILDLSFFLNMQ